MRVTLPTEAQREYACRAGTKTRYYSGDKEDDLRKIAWYRENSGDAPHEVGKKEPNAFGLYDMLGNVCEPCVDVLLSRYDAIKDTDPKGHEDGVSGMMRGGCWQYGAKSCRAAARLWSDDRFSGMGIRIAINPGE